MLKQRLSWKRLIAVLFLFAVVISAVSFSTMEADTTPNKIQEVYDLLNENHLEGNKEEEMTNAAIQAMVEVYGDPYTQYFNPEEWKEFQRTMQSSYVGIGVRIAQDEEGISIVEVFDESSAKEAGLKSGDYITAVEGNAVGDKTTSELVQEIIGPEKTKVNITITRDGEKMDFKLERRQVQIPAVQSFMFSDGVGYLQLNSFSEDADKEFANGLESLQKEDMQSLIIDLRNNPGGYLDIALNISKLFIEEGTLIYTKDNKGDLEGLAIKNGKEAQHPITIMLNENSASASEVLSGALQDYELATIVGTKSFGKGSVQRLFPLTDGSMIKITMEEYLTPKKRKVNGEGLPPDVNVEGAAEQLITAMHTAGVKNFNISLNEELISINDKEYSTDVELVEENGNVYAPVRFLASLIGAEVKWNSEAEQVELVIGEQSQVLKENEYQLYRDGKNYVDVQHFASQYSILEATAKEDGWQFTIKK
ncbi:S41 family peptidase [Longirhabdus pacifica]|uniref:S41 family peptidase n=1 Tax=Longirhabdus pacifica TaxID=2305227 RepID=UPI0013E8B884|nr:S41 family peptidase [Longirhabdus pacifica]